MTALPCHVVQNVPVMENTMLEVDDVALDTEGAEFRQHPERAKKWHLLQSMKRGLWSSRRLELACGTLSRETSLTCWTSDPGTVGYYIRVVCSC